jgi:hypothetical protein
LGRLVERWCCWLEREGEEDKKEEGEEDKKGEGGGKKRNEKRRDEAKHNL